MKITKTTLKSVQPSDKDQWIWDSTLPGFGVRVWPTGRAVYVVRYRTGGGTQRKLTIGDARVMDPDAAREEARRLMGVVREGNDPQKQRSDARAAHTVEDLSRDYLEHQKATVKGSTLDLNRRLWRIHLIPAFGSTKITELSLEQVERWHRKMGAKKRTANQCVTQLKAAMNWAVGRGWARKNPLRAFSMYPNLKRQLILQPAQVQQLFVALERTPTTVWSLPYLYKLLMFTGLRMNEWAKAEWSWYSDEMQTLSLPDSKTGARVVQLGDDAVGLIRQLRAHPRAHRRWMFPNSKGEPVDCSYKYWDEVRTAIGLPNLRVHDLRHTYASYALTQVNIKEVQQMLGHASVVTTERYLHVFDDALQAAQSKAGALMSQLAITGQRPNPPEKKAARRLTVVK